MRSIEKYSYKGKAWGLSSGTRVLTAVNRTALVYMRNLDEQRKIVLSDLFLGGGQAAHWALYVGVTQATEGNLANALTPRNLDISWTGPDGVPPVNGVWRGGNDGNLQVGGNVLLHFWTRSFETLHVPLDGALRLGHDDALVINCEPNVGGTFSADVEFWQVQEGPETGAAWV